MSKIAFIFPGQGAQTCGMGKDFYEHTETGRKVFDKATELLGFSVPELCFEPNDRLDITEYTQAAMVHCQHCHDEGFRRKWRKTGCSSWFKPW